MQEPAPSAPENADVAGAAAPIEPAAQEKAPAAAPAPEKAAPAPAAPTVSAPAPVVLPRSLKAGDTLLFGSYFQDLDAGEEKEPIEWLVLAVEEGTRALLISKYGLDAKPYHENFRAVAWESCSLRAWLNGAFLTEAFRENEQSRILVNRTDNSKKQCYPKWTAGACGSTEDKVFLLSCREATEYFSVSAANAYNTAARLAPTSYALSRGADPSHNKKTESGEYAAFWWLRSPGPAPSSAAVVYYTGALQDRNVSSGWACVRPALWIDLSQESV